jgi:hypothetical protein
MCSTTAPCALLFLCSVLCLQARLAVDCCLLLLKELAALSAEVPVLLAVDGYNALHWRSDYGRTISRTPRGKPAYQYRQEIPVRKLNLVGATCYIVML